MLLPRRALGLSTGAAIEKLEGRKDEIIRFFEHFGEVFDRFFYVEPVTETLSKAFNPLVDTESVTETLVNAFNPLFVMDSVTEHLVKAFNRLCSTEPVTRKIVKSVDRLVHTESAKLSSGWCSLFLLSGLN
jgi:hypothetical protein